MRKDNDRQFAVLGLGIFGSTVAKTLSAFDFDVLALDNDIKCVDRLAEVVTQCMQCDITDKEQLRAAGVADCDIAIIAMGTHLEETVLAIINLKELGVPYIVCKAKNKSYMQIFSKVGADKVVRPEKEAGAMLAKSFLSNSIIDMVDIDSDYSIVEIEVPAKWAGKSLQDLDIRNKYGINVIGVRKHTNMQLSISPSADYVVEAGDHMLVVADVKSFERFDFLNKL